MGEAKTNPSAGMDVVIYGMMRSGTTLVADLLSIKGESLIVSEPDFHVQWHARTMERVDAVLKQVGIPAPTPPAEPGAYGSYLGFFEQKIVPLFGGLKLWGIKQVDFLGWDALLDHCKPKSLILCVRDIRDIALSALDLVNAQTLGFPGGRYLRDEAWVLTRLCHDVVDTLAMAKRADLVLRYEEFTTDKTQQVALARQVGLDRFSTRRPNLASEQGRAAGEAKKHREVISSASVGRYAREPDGPAKALADRVWRLLPEYSKAFGYPEPPAIRVDKHPLREPLRTKVGNLKPDLYEDWDWLGPKQLEPSFATRRARMLVCKRIPPTANLLDIGSPLPALAVMFGNPMQHQLAEHTGRFRHGIKADWIAAKFPPVRRFSHFTALGVLEYVEDLPRLLRRLRLFDRPGMVSYHTADKVPMAHRLAHGWRSHMSRDELTQVLRDAGFKFEATWDYDGLQSILFLEPG